MELYQMMMDNPDLIVIDVSPVFEQGHIPGALNYYVGDGSLDNAIPDLDPSADHTWLNICQFVQGYVLGDKESWIDLLYYNYRNYPNNSCMQAIERKTRSIQQFVKTTNCNLGDRTESAFYRTKSAFDSAVCKNEKLHIG